MKESVKMWISFRKPAFWWSISPNFTKRKKHDSVVATKYTGFPESMLRDRFIWATYVLLAVSVVRCLVAKYAPSMFITITNQENTPFTLWRFYGVLVFVLTDLRSAYFFITTNSDKFCPIIFYNAFRFNV